MSVQSQLVPFISNKTVYNEILVYCLKIMYFYCTYSIRTKILTMLGTGYFLKIAKINFQ